MAGASRAAKSGIGADIQKKMEAKYDAAVEEGAPQKVVAWINAVLQGVHDPCPGYQAEQIAEYLQNGVALCKLMNKLQGNDKCKFNAKSTQRFVCMGHIECFVKAAESNFGMKPTETFQANDLYEGLKGNMINIVNSLHELGLRANQRGYSPKYAGSGRMAEENVRGFSEEEIKKASAKTISKVAAGSHGGATQSGMSFGTTRKI